VSGGGGYIFKDFFYTGAAGYYSDYLTIANNNISYNGDRITLSDSSNNNNITGNIVFSNKGGGMYLCGSRGNMQSYETAMFYEVVF